MSAVRDHTSGCSYDMAAGWVKGKKRVFGFNRLTDPAHVKSNIYPLIAGRHAELHVVMNALLPIKGGTLYVVGVRSTVSRNDMLNTAPCKYCRELLKTTRIKYLVYFIDGQLVKESL